MSGSKRRQKFFITHSSKDAEFARRLVDDLRKNGFDGFLDIYSIKPGDNIAERIGRELDECDVYIPLLSFASLSSRWCNEEITAAINLTNDPERNGRPHIIPVLLENCQRQMHVLLRSRLYINFADRYKEAFKELLENGFEVDWNQLFARSTVTKPKPEHHVERKPQRYTGILTLTAENIADLVSQAKRELPNMSWGMIGGKNGRARKIFPMKNVSPTPVTRFIADPLELLRVTRDIEEVRGWDILVIYYSDPYGEPYPSSITISEAHYPDSVYVIISLKNPEQVKIRGYRIVDGRATEVTIDVE